METTTNKTEAFLSAIQTIAAEECKRIDGETDALREQRLQTIKSESRKRYKSYMEYEIARINADFNRENSALEEQARKQLTAQRSAIFESVFREAETQVRQFTETPAYQELLAASVRKIAEILAGDRVRLYVRAADEAFAESLCAAFSEAAEIVIADDIRLGGVRAEGIESKQLADDTLDMRLEEQKQRFLSESGLSLEG